MNEYFIKGAVSVEVSNSSGNATIWLKPAEGFLSKGLSDGAMAFSSDPSNPKECMILDFDKDRKKHIKLEIGDTSVTYFMELPIKAAESQKQVKIFLKIARLPRQALHRQPILQQ